MVDVAKAFFDLVFWLIVGAAICVWGLEFNPWSLAVDWIWKLRGKEPVFNKKRARKEKRVGALTQTRVFVTTGTKNGVVVQENVVARNEDAARDIAADHWRIEADDIDATELVDKALRRGG